MQRKNTFQRLAIPDGIQLALFLIAFVATVSPYTSGVDLGFVKVPDLSSLPILRIIGPVALVALLSCYLMIWPVKEPKEQSCLNKVYKDVYKTEDFSVVAVITSSDHQEHSDLQSIRTVWLGEVLAVQQATREDFCDLVLSGPDVLHVEATIDRGIFHLSDGNLGAEEFGNLLKGAEKPPKLVVLSSCDSLQVAQNMQSTGVAWSVVAHDWLRVGLSTRFFEQFYRTLSKSGDVERAFRAAGGRAGSLPLSLTRH